MVHYGDNMPSSQAMEGYDLINPSTGEVIRHIDRAKTPQELAAEAAAKAAAKQAAEKKRAEEEAQAQRDHMLLDLYSTTDDLERARKQRLEEIDGLIKQTENAWVAPMTDHKHAPGLIGATSSIPGHAATAQEFVRSAGAPPRYRQAV